MKVSINILLCFVGLITLCSCSSPSSHRTYPATIRRTPFERWETTQVSELGLSLEKPSGLRLMGSSRSILIQLHGVSAQSTFPSDTQYLITISINMYSKEEWESEAAFQMKINNKVKDEKWLYFRQWAYSSLIPEVTMREHDGERYYRRALVNPSGAVVKISAEYIPKFPEKIAEDDAAIRRIISSVAFIEDKKDSIAPVPVQTTTNAVSNVAEQVI